MIKRGLYRPSSRLFERESSLEKLVNEVNSSVMTDDQSFLVAPTKKIACDQLKTLCPDYEPSRFPGGAMCRSGEDSNGYPYRDECTHGCMVSQFTLAGVFLGKEEAKPLA